MFEECETRRGRLITCRAFLHRITIFIRQTSRSQLAWVCEEARFQSVIDGGLLRPAGEARATPAWRFP